MNNKLIKMTLLVVMSGMMIVGLCAFTSVLPVQAATAAAGNPPANPPENPAQPKNVLQQEKPAGEPASVVSPEPEPEPEPEPVRPQLSDSEIAGLKEAVKAGKDARISSHVSGNRMPLLRIWIHCSRSLPSCFVWQKSMASMWRPLHPAALRLHLRWMMPFRRLPEWRRNMPAPFARLPADGDHSDLAEQYANMKNASQNNHLPKFEQKP